MSRKKLWFERLFGCEEATFASEMKEDISCVEEGGLFYLTGPNQKKYCAGRFEHVSVTELQSREQSREQESEESLTTMTIKSGDVVRFICNPDNNGAVFQVASQFNCLEFINSAITPEAGVERYEYDHTQGPACSIACGPATVYRNYFVDMPIRESSGSWTLGSMVAQTTPQQGQSKDRQLDGFDDITQILHENQKSHERLYYTMNNGYLTADRTQLEEFNARLAGLKAEKGWDEEEAANKEMWSRLKLGVHYDVEVTAQKWGSELTDSPEQRITQVFASAAAVGYSRSINRKLWASLATGILNASYEGIFSVAAQNPTKRLFLTFIGGGVFQNSMTWIADAILRAALIYKKSGVKVFLVCYGDVPKGIGEMVEKFKKLR